MMSLKTVENPLEDKITYFDGYNTPKRKRSCQPITPSPQSVKIRRSPRLSGLQLNSSPSYATQNVLADTSSDESTNTPFKRRLHSFKSQAMLISGLTSEGNSPSSSMSSPPRTPSSPYNEFPRVSRSSPRWQQKFRKALNEIAWEEMNRVRFQASGFYGKKIQTHTPLLAKKLSYSSRDDLVTTFTQTPDVKANEKKSVVKARKSSLKSIQKIKAKTKGISKKNQNVSKSRNKISFKIKDWNLTSAGRINENIKEVSPSKPNAKLSPKRFFSKSKVSPSKKPTSTYVIGNHRVHMPATKFIGNSKPKIKESINAVKLLKMGKKTKGEMTPNVLSEMKERMDIDEQVENIDNKLQIVTDNNSSQKNEMFTAVIENNPSTSSKSDGSTVKCYSIFDKQRRTSPRSPKPNPKIQPIKQTSRQLRSLKSKNDGMEQLVIDAGQKEVGAIQCSQCGMIYVPCDEVDSNTHDYYHNALLNSLRFLGWKKERVLQEFHDGRIIRILPEDPKYALLKAQEIQQVIDSELGFAENRTSEGSLLQYFFFISTEKMIVGCLIAEPITQAYRIISDNQKSLCCDTDPIKAACGVSRLWTLTHYRKNKIATRLMEVLRTNFVYGYVLAKEDIAFSSPTADGRAFATKYTNTESFLVYK